MNIQTKIQRVDQLRTTMPVGRALKKVGLGAPTYYRYKRDQATIGDPEPAPAKIQAYLTVPSNKVALFWGYPKEVAEVVKSLQ